MESAHNLTIIDAHAHIFPDKIAAKAVSSIGDFYQIPMSHPGSARALVASGSAVGVRKYLVCSTATRPGQVAAINDFIQNCCALYPEFYGFATLHPALEKVEEEVERIVSMGLHGVKLHPDFQEFNIDSPEAMPLYKACAQAGLPILFHTGDRRYDWSAPSRLARVAGQFPRLTCIAAHFGGYDRWQDVEVYRGLENVYFDTSSSLFALPKDRALELLETLGTKRFFFGTDFPMWDHTQELGRFLALDLPVEVRDDILWRNFQRVFQVAL